MEDDSIGPTKSRRDDRRLPIYDSCRLFGALPSRVYSIPWARAQGHNMSSRRDLRRIVVFQPCRLDGFFLPVGHAFLPVGHSFLPFD